MHISIMITMSKDEESLVKPAKELMPDLLSFLNAPADSTCNVHVSITDEASSAMDQTEPAPV